MASALRLAFSGALYHITWRGDRREDIDDDDNDRPIFLNLLGDVWKINALTPILDKKAIDGHRQPATRSKLPISMAEEELEACKRFYATQEPATF